VYGKGGRAVTATGHGWSLRVIF